VSMTPLRFFFDQTMRAEIEFLTEAAKQSIGLLRRHL
jgi:hypothetical protein